MSKQLGYGLCRGSGGHARREIYGAAYSTFTSAAFPAVTVTFCSFSPSDSCHVLTVYSPGGRPLISNDPSSLLTEKYGCSNTAMYALIHGCTSHFTRNVSATLGAST